MLINESILTSEYPTAWKVAKVIALPKVGDNKEINNYRPISILNTVPKIIERHIYNHMYKYFCKNNLLSVNQSGFRSGYSCESCLLKITNKWYNTINNGKVVGFVALNLT